MLIKLKGKCRAHACAIFIRSPIAFDNYCSDVKDKKQPS